jgi:hypothetical protein
MFNIGDRVQVYNHSEEECNGQYGTITHVHTVYNGGTYYTVGLDYSHVLCTCTDDEVMEG